MIRSVRLKVLIYMVLNILVFAFLLYAANLLFAEKFYLVFYKIKVAHLGKKLLTKSSPPIA